MVAFTIFGWPIYRYGIFYMITFVVGYFFLWYLGKTKAFVSYTGLQKLLTDKRDDLVLMIMLGVIVGGRLGHVFIYEAAYYIQHPLEIIQIRQGGMSFIGGVIGVVIGIFWLARKLKLKKDEMFLLGDIILCIVPLGSLLGRIGNYLNQELRGVPLDTLPNKFAGFFENLGLTRVYDQVDSQVRVNTNFLQSTTEGAFILLFNWGLLFGKYLQGQMRPGLITGVFFMLYGMFRFFAEFVKDLPAYEMWGVLSVTQWIMFIFIGLGIYFLETSQKTAN